MLHVLDKVVVSEALLFSIDAFVMGSSVELWSAAV